MDDDSGKFSRAMRWLRYVTGTAIVLAVKVLLTHLLTGLDFAIAAAYLITHGFILFLSYFYHSLVSFRARPTWASFRAFVAATALFKALDYLLVTVSVSFRFLGITYAILLVTILIYLLRYWAIRRLFDRRGNSPYDDAL